MPHTERVANEKRPENKKASDHNEVQKDVKNKERGVYGPRG